MEKIGEFTRAQSAYLSKDLRKIHYVCCLQEHKLNINVCQFLLALKILFLNCPTNSILKTFSGFTVRFKSSTIILWDFCLGTIMYIRGEEKLNPMKTKQSDKNHTRGCPSQIHHKYPYHALLSPWGQTTQTYTCTSQLTSAQLYQLDA